MREREPIWSAIRTILFWEDQESWYWTQREENRMQKTSLTLDMFLQVQTVIYWFSILKLNQWTKYKNDCWIKKCYLPLGFILSYYLPINYLLIEPILLNK